MRIPAADWNSGAIDQNHLAGGLGALTKRASRILAAPAQPRWRKVGVLLPYLHFFQSLPPTHTHILPTHSHSPHILPGWEAQVDKTQGKWRLPGPSWPIAILGGKHAPLAPAFLPTPAILGCPLAQLAHQCTTSWQARRSCASIFSSFTFHESAAVATVYRFSRCFRPKFPPPPLGNDYFCAQSRCWGCAFVYMYISPARS